MQHVIGAVIALALEDPAHRIAARHIVRRHQAIATDNRVRAQREHERRLIARQAAVKIAVEPFARVGRQQLTDRHTRRVLR